MPTRRFHNSERIPLRFENHGSRCRSHSSDDQRMSARAAWKIEPSSRGGAYVGCANAPGRIMNRKCDILFAEADKLRFAQPFHKFERQATRCSDLLHMIATELRNRGIPIDRLGTASTGKWK